MVKDHSAREKKPVAATTMGYSFKLAARDLLYALYHQQVAHTSLCFTSHEALAGTRYEKEERNCFL